MNKEYRAAQGIPLSAPSSSRKSSSARYSLPSPLPHYLQDMMPTKLLCSAAAQIPRAGAIGRRLPLSPATGSLSPVCLQVAFIQMTVLPSDWELRTQCQNFLWPLNEALERRLPWTVP